MSNQLVQAVALHPDQFETLRRALDPKQFKQAVYQAVRRTTNAATKIVRGIVQEQTTLNDKYARRVIKTKIEPGENPVGHVVISQELIPLVGYQTTAYSRAAGGGVVVRVSKTRPVISLRHAFMAKLQTAAQAASGARAHQGIAQRATHLPSKGPHAGRNRKLTPRGFAGQFAIEEAFGPSVLQIIEQADVMKETTNRLGDRLSKEMEGQLGRFTTES